MKINHFEKLSIDYLELLNDEEGFNVIINVGEVPNIKIFHAHSGILKQRSSYFQKELMNINKDQNNIKTIHIRNVSIQHFELIIKYIYGGTILLEILDEPFIFELMLVAHIFFLEELVKHLEAYLIKENVYWLRSNISRVHQLSFQNTYLQGLRKWCNETLARDPGKVFNTEGFISLQENALISLVGRDDLQMTEVEVWNAVIKWGIAQIPGLSDDPRDWFLENLQALKTILQHCLPLIRYFQISADDITKNVQPYQQILDEELWNDITKRLKHPNSRISSIVLPPRIILPPFRAIDQFSRVINEVDAAEIASWIDWKAESYSVANNPYSFNLLFRGSRDGFTSEAFWELCDREEDLVVVVKVEGTDEILGGYNSIGWDRPDFSIGEDGDPCGEYEICDDSFIFSLKNSTLQKSILSRVEGSRYAIYNEHDYGPCFGGDPYGYKFDLLIFDEGGKCSCQHSTYRKPIRKNTRDLFYSNTSFSVVECEIFQVVKKS